MGKLSYKDKLDNKQIDIIAHQKRIDEIYPQVYRHYDKDLLGYVAPLGPTNKNDTIESLDKEHTRLKIEIDNTRHFDRLFNCENVRQFYDALCHEKNRQWTINELKQLLKICRLGHYPEMIEKMLNNRILAFVPRPDMDKDDNDEIVLNLRSPRVKGMILVYENSLESEYL